MLTWRKPGIGRGPGASAGRRALVCAVIISWWLWSRAPVEGRQETLDASAVAKSARDVPSLYLTPEHKQEVAQLLIELVGIRSPSGQEQAIRANLRDRLARLQAVEIAAGSNATDAPPNLVMELGPSNDCRDRPGILLNAHIDTIAAATPDQLRFDAATGDFYHADEGSGAKRSSFGADDKAGVAVIVGALSALKQRFWSTNAPHRRIVVAFTADEERRSQGARYLAEHHAEVFKDLELSLTFDGPIDFHSDYPAVGFLLVVSQENARQQPYRRVIELAEELAQKKQLRCGRTETGLGMGDFAKFPLQAHSGLHIRSPQRGFHTRERVKLSDLINHVDLLCHILLAESAAVRSPSR